VYELNVTVKKVMGECTASHPVKPGDSFIVSDGDIHVPGGGHICAWALASLIPLIVLKEREIAENKDEDWVWRVDHAQCPDPDGRVIFEIERTGKMDMESRDYEKDLAVDRAAMATAATESDTDAVESVVKDVQVVVESVKGKCTSRMEPGDSVTLSRGRFYFPPGSHFCLYALQAVLPLMPAKQRAHQDGDWIKDEFRVICPDPAGNVIMRIDRKD
jgi:uncharacterized repeat protein (TIGR04076 family)